jgi:hypothetical protein
LGVAHIRFLLFEYLKKKKKKKKKKVCNETIVVFFFYRAWEVSRLPESEGEGATAALGGAEIVAPSAVEVVEDLRKPQFPNQLEDAAVSSAGAEATWFSISSFLAHISGAGPRSYSLRM